MKGDEQFYEEILTAVAPCDGGWTIQAGAWCFFLDRKHGVEPKAGDLARFYGKRFGRVRGLLLNGRRVFYRTESEDREIVRAAVQEQRDEKRRKASTPWAAMRRAWLLLWLPSVFRKRLMRFQRNNPDFYWDGFWYEAMTCRDAVRIARSMRKINSSDPLVPLRLFLDATPEAQRHTVPGLDKGHSGNTFGMATRLAHHWLTDERLVFAEHAALAVLVGCDKAGCPPVTDDEMRQAGFAPLLRESE